MCNEDLLSKAVVFVSGEYLTEALPVNFNDMSEAELIQFVEDNVAKDFEDWNSLDLLKRIQEVGLSCYKFTAGVSPWLVSPVINKECSLDMVQSWVGSDNLDSRSLLVFATEVLNGDYDNLLSLREGVLDYNE